MTQEKIDANRLYEKFGKSAIDVCDEILDAVWDNVRHWERVKNELKNLIK